MACAPHLSGLMCLCVLHTYENILRPRKGRQHKAARKTAYWWIERMVCFEQKGKRRRLSLWSFGDRFGDLQIKRAPCALQRSPRGIERERATRMSMQGLQHNASAHATHPTTRTHPPAVEKPDAFGYSALGWLCLCLYSQWSGGAIALNLTPYQLHLHNKSIAAHCAQWLTFAHTKKLLHTHSKHPPGLGNRDGL